MYLRFVIADIDEDSERMLGVFHAVWNLRDQGRLDQHEEEEHDSIREWFSENLERPKRFNVPKAPFCRKKSRAICWFKDTAQEHLAWIRGLVAILENHGVQVLTLKSDRAGYIVYEDEYQVAAEPFKDMRC